MVSLWPTYPPTHSTTNSGLRLEEYPVLPKSARSQPARLPRLGGLAKRGQQSAEGALRRPSQERDGDESRCLHRVDPGGSERGVHCELILNDLEPVLLLDTNDSSSSHQKK